MTEATADHAPSPLAILLAVMRAKWQEGDLDGAVAIARIAAPYVHARRSSIADSLAAGDPARLSDDELERAQRRAGAAPAHPDLFGRLGAPGAGAAGA